MYGRARFSKVRFAGPIQTASALPPTSVGISVFLSTGLLRGINPGRSSGLPIGIVAGRSTGKGR